MEKNEESLQNYLYANIPITQAIEVNVELASLGQVILSAPFAKNFNHQKTIFGGSLHSLATLSCWSLLYLNVKALNLGPVDIVITHSSIAYKVPVKADFKALCLFPKGDTWQRFIHMLRVKGKARIALSATIVQNGQLAVDYQATFAAIKLLVKN